MVSDRSTAAAPFALVATFSVVGVVVAPLLVLVGVVAWVPALAGADGAAGLVLIAGAESSAASCLAVILTGFGTG